jgi:Flp pilus assembly protein TadD
MSPIKNSGIILATILLVTTLVYLNSLKNPFVIDDRVIIFNNFRSSWTVGNLFQRSLFSVDPSESSYFRPLTLLTFGLNYSLAGEKPQGYRAVNLAVHLIVIVLMTLLLSPLAGRWVAGFAALLFALHPANVQAVSYISSRSDLLYTALGLLCLLFWRKGNDVQGRKRTLFLCLALAAFFLGLFAKETMMVVPPLALLTDFAWNRNGSWQNKLRENLGWYLGFLVLFFAYLLIRVSLGFPLNMEADKNLDSGSRPLLALKLLGLYLGVVFYPLRLSLFRVVPIPQTLLEWQVLLGILLLAGFAIAAYLFWSPRREISFGILWFLISLFPILNLTLLNAPMMEHWLYLPLIGLSLAFVGGIRTLAEKIGETRVAAFALTLIALLLAARTVTRNAEWKDLPKIFSRDVISYPGNYLAWFWLADARKKQGMAGDAISAFRTGLAINPNFKRAWMDLGELLSLAGRNDEAELAFSRALPIEPQDALVYQMLGVHRLKTGKNKGAIEALTKGSELKPSAAAYHALGSAYLRQGETARAEEAFQTALNIYPQKHTFHAGTHINFGKLYMSEGKQHEAVEEWKLALKFDPDNREARTLLGRELK